MKDLSPDENYRVIEPTFVEKIKTFFVQNLEYIIFLKN